MTLNRWLSTTTAIILLLNSPVNGETINESVAAMLRFEPELMSVDSDSRACFEDYRITKAKRRPVISLTSDSGLSQRDRSTDGLVASSSGNLYSRDLGISIRQLVYDGGTSKMLSASAKQSYRAQRLLQLAIIEDRVVDLVETYLEILRLNEQICEAKKNIAYHKEFHEKLLKYEQLGGSRSDTMLIEGRLSLAKSSLRSIQSEKETAESRYRRLTGEIPRHLTKPEIPRIEEIADTCEITGNWHFQAACATFDSASTALLAKKSAHLPNLYINTGATEGYDTVGIKGRDREIHALLGLQWDLYRGGQRRALSEREKWQQDKAFDLVRTAVENGRQKARDIYTDLQRSRDCRSSLDTYVNRLESVATDYGRQFQIGSRDLMNLLGIENELFQAKLKLINALYSEHACVYRLLGVQGKLACFLTGNKILDLIETGCAEQDEWSCRLKPGSSPGRSETVAIPVENCLTSKPIRATPVKGRRLFSFIRK